MSTILTLFLFLSPSLGQSCTPTSGQWHLPLHNKTALRHESAPQWVPEPQIRGTFSILYSCTFTLFLCIYTAVHLNVPPREGHIRFYVRKTKWVMVALLSPEVVLYSAWSQWKRAREFVDMMDVERERARSQRRWGVQSSNNSFSSEENDSKNYAPPNSCYTLLDGFYTVMGGFVVDLEDGDLLEELIRVEKREDYSPLEPLRMTLTTAAVENLAKENGIFLKALKSTIKDKSKADVLAKGLVCCQVLWMVVQSIARTMKGYPLTLLEIHTLVHVICALCMYFLWFEKPLDIHDPTVVDGQAQTQLLRKFKEQLARRGEQSTGPTLLRRRGASNRDPGEPDPGPVLLERRAKNIYFHHKVVSLSGDFWVMMLLSVLYGGVHTLAWKIAFPTELEQVLWRVFCILTIAGSPLAYVMTDAAAEIGTFAAVIMSLLFVASRVVITVESFISIRKVPAGAYATVDWTQAIPHF
ncbi:hypothetical protein BDD12DRAFT_830621 [Trichophaea hybrida]|nr:hypothetical protein BDD12DRAFT_830621 [Trichophaea hybrida]